MAIQIYIPESSSLIFHIWSVPSGLTCDLPTGSWLFSLTHMIFGLGSPAAWHETEIFCSWLTLSWAGGFDVNRGSSKTLRSVKAESSPKSFDALHSYKPESLFWALIIDSCPSSTTVLEYASSPRTLDQVMTAGGKLVTWHFGNVMFLPFSK